MAKLNKGFLPAGAGMFFEATTGEHWEVRLDDMPEDIRHQLMLHGLSQKLGDCFAKDSVSEGVAAFEATLANLKNGIWRASSHGILAEAISNLTGKPLGEVRQMLDGLDKAKKAKLRRDVNVKAEMLRLQQERLGETATDEENVLDTLFS